MTQLWTILIGVLIWLFVGFVVCSYVLAKPDQFSWRRWLHPFVWWSDEDVFLQAAFWLAPVWPIVLVVAGFAKWIAGTVDMSSPPKAPQAPESTKDRA